MTASFSIISAPTQVFNEWCLSAHVTVLTLKCVVILNQSGGINVRYKDIMSTLYGADSSEGSKSKAARANRLCHLLGSYEIEILDFDLPCSHREDAFGRSLVRWKNGWRASLVHWGRFQCSGGG